MIFSPSTHAQVQSEYGGTPYSFGPPPAIATETVGAPAETAAPVEAPMDNWAALAQVGGLLGAGLVSKIAEGESLKTQQASDLKTAKSQAKLLAAQTKASTAAAKASAAQSLVQGLATRRTLYIAGGVVLAVALLAGTVFLLKDDPE